MIGSETRGVVVAPRPASWRELMVAFLLGMLAMGVLTNVGVALAGGPVALTWNQASDCSEVTGWELLVAPITTANPNPQPTAAVVGVSFANDQPPCGLNMTRTVNVASGVGPQRFWLRALAGAVKSDVSNAVNASMPLSKPTGLQLVVP